MMVFNVQGLVLRKRFSPLSILGCKLWLDASRIAGLADGDAVTTWSDLSGNGNDATQATASKKPLYKVGIVNGQPVVRFDGTDDWLRTAVWGTPLAQPSTLLVVARYAVTVAQAIYDGLANGSRQLGYINAAQFRVYAGAEPSGLAVDINWHVFVGDFNGASGGQYIDGTRYAGNVGTESATGLTLGASYANTIPLNGDVTLALVYNRTLANSERQRLERWAGRQYGIAVA